MTSTTSFTMKKILALLLVIVLAGCEDSHVAPEDDGPRFMALAADGALTAGLSTFNAAQVCMHDVKTGLDWELKAEDGLRSFRHTYSWYAPDEAHHELDYRGSADGGTCTDSACDTWSYVNAVNDSHLCGHDDWRMPSRDELSSITDLRKAKAPPTIDTVAFPRTQPEEYWTAHDYSFESSAAWAWNFRYGHDRVDWKKSPKFIRLVRGDAIWLAEVKE